MNEKKRSVVWLIFKRCLLEFIPPAVVALFATYISWDGLKALSDMWLTFTAAFTACGLIWFSFLRIQYQQTNRAAQDDAADQLEEVRKDVARVEVLLKDLPALLAPLKGTLSKEAENAVATANTNIQTANTILNDARPRLERMRGDFQRLIIVRGPPTANS